ncbi:putative integral membrane protein [Acanthocheilonema viteae]
MRKTLRDAYIVLAAVFLNSGFTAIGVILMAMKRLFRSIDGKLISHHECVLDLSILLLTALSLNGFSLLMNSADRLSVVAFPLYYYTHNTRISYSLIAAQYVITSIAVISTVIASLIEPTRQISNFCMLHSVYSSHFYKVILLLACSTSFLSVVLMVIVVVILRKKFGAQFLSNNSHNFDLSIFLNNQKRYTQTAIISCCLTFFLVVIPSTLEYIYLMDSTIISQTIVICCAHLRQFDVNSRDGFIV